MIGLPAGVRVNWRRILPMASSYALRRTGEARVAYRIVICGVTWPSRAIRACRLIPALEPGGPRMPELMAGDDQYFPAGAAQSRGFCGGEQAVAEPGRAYAP